MSQDAVINGMVKGCEVLYKLIEFFLSQKQKQIDTLTKERDDLKKELVDAKKEYENNPKTKELKDKIDKLEKDISSKDKEIDANKKAMGDFSKLNDAIYKQQCEYKAMGNLNMYNLTEDQKTKFNDMRREYIGAVVDNLKSQGVTKEQFDAYVSNPESVSPELKIKIETAKANAVVDKTQKDIMAKPENKELPPILSKFIGQKDKASLKEKMEAALETGNMSKAEINEDISKGFDQKNNDAPVL